MGLGEQIYLILVIAAFAIFGIALALGSAYERAGAKRHIEADRSATHGA